MAGFQTVDAYDGDETMTNLVTNTIAGTSGEQSAGFLAQYTGEIIVGVITATLLGAGALLWQLFVYPGIQKWQKRKATEAKRNEIITSLNEMGLSFGYRMDFRDRAYIAVTLPNNTAKPLIVRDVSFRPHGGPRGGAWLRLWHDPADKIDPQTTERVRTGIKLPPQSKATWYYVSADMRGAPLIVRKCSVEFEYETADGETYLHEMYSPAKLDDEIARMFQSAWDAMTRKLDEKEGKKPQSNLVHEPLAG